MKAIGSLVFIVLMLGGLRFACRLAERAEERRIKRRPVVTPTRRQSVTEVASAPTIDGAHLEGDELREAFYRVLGPEPANWPIPGGLTADPNHRRVFGPRDEQDAS